MEKASSLLRGSRKDKEAAARICQIPGTMGTIMHAIALHFFGTDVYEWEPETIDMEFEEEFGVIPYEGNINKLNAILSSVASDSFYNDWVAYLNVCTTLSGENDAEDLLDLTVEELAWGVMEISLNDEDYDPKLFHSDIRALTGIVLDEEGYFSPPPQLSFAKMPYRYFGDDYGPDINKQKVNSEHSVRLLSEYLQNQVLTLYKQIKVIPWLDESDFSLAIREASNQLTKLKNSSSFVI